MEGETGAAEEYGRKSRAVLITGASSGIGFAAARMCAERGDLVIGIGRSKERCEWAARQLRGRRSGGQVEFVITDLSEMGGVRRAAGEVKKLLGKAGRRGLDVLINNAAAVPSSYTVTADGYEMQLAVNHLASFLLTCRLLPLLAASGDGRIITVSSRSHRWGKIHWNDPHLHRGYNPLRAYCQTKLANLLFTLELNRRIPEGVPVCALALDPGLVRTEIGHKRARGIAYFIWSLRMLSGRPPEEPAAVLRYLSAAPREQLAEAGSGLLWTRRGLVKPAAKALDADAARRLWELSEELCGCDFTELSGSLGLHQT
jgi:NAD(P)-dependent dehydrogenase (short-subunit alcohol dehydrogenase family)